MKILAIDIGAGTQDIIYYNSEKELENSTKLVLPSPPVHVVEKIQKTKHGKNIYFDGDIMGGGKIKGAIIAKLKEGSKIAMEPNAAKTIKDDLSVAKSLGIEIVEEGSFAQNSSKFADYSKITLEDINIKKLSSTIANYDFDFEFEKIAISKIAIAVQDHGYNPEMGDRDFRFEKIREKLNKPLPPEDFAYYGDIPDYFTRMKSVERNLKQNLVGSEAINYEPVLMDSKFASICGACYDPEVKKLNSYVVMDIGNGHTMAAAIEKDNGKDNWKHNEGKYNEENDGKNNKGNESENNNENNLIQGVFEHHTSNLAADPEKMKELIEKLVAGTLTHKEIHEDNGHGAHVINPISTLEKVVVTGPKRAIIKDTGLDYYNAAPGGDVMMTGPVGLIKTVEYKKNNIK
jgi:uncharacterized protein (DUF1786 family)